MPDTPGLLSELLVRYNEAKREGRTHPLVLVGALIVDLLAIHPVADGNGRLARLLTTYELLAAGYGVARYVSVEQRIYEAKNAYYQEPPRIPAWLAYGRAHDLAVDDLSDPDPR